jgi:hypothetical protein
MRPPKRIPAPCALSTARHMAGPLVLVRCCEWPNKPMDSIPPLSSVNIINNKIYIRQHYVISTVCKENQTLDQYFACGWLFFLLFKILVFSEVLRGACLRRRPCASPKRFARCIPPDGDMAYRRNVAMKTSVPFPARPAPSYWHEGLKLTLAVFRMAKCPPDKQGDVVGSLIAHKAQRDRASKDDDARPKHRS